MARIKSEHHDEIANRDKDPRDYLDLNDLTETHGGHWNDRFNNVFVDRETIGFQVSVRGHGNRSVLVGAPHVQLDDALQVAASISNDRALFERYATDGRAELGGAA